MTDMTRAEVQLKLQDVFRAVFNDDSLIVTDKTTAADIKGWDSLQQIKIILRCEKAFGIRLRARDINALENIGEMTDHLIAAVNKAVRK
jgi:acyl carrier protein